MSGRPTVSQDAVATWLSTQGYPLEFRAARAFRDAGFTTSQGEYVSAPDSEKHLEIDVLAEHIGSSRNDLFRLTYVVECKYLLRPWIFFKSGEMSQSTIISAGDYVASRMGAAALWVLEHSRQLHDVPALRPSGAMLAFGVCDYLGEADVPPGSALVGGVAAGQPKRKSKEDGADDDRRNERCYATFQGLIARAVGYIDIFGEPEALWSTGIGIPVIVVKGQLFAAVYDESTEGFTVTEVDHVAVGWNGSLAAGGRAVVHVVRVESLPAFLEPIKNSLETADQRLRSVLERIRDAAEAQDYHRLGIGGLGRPMPMPSALVEMGLDR